MTDCNHTKSELTGHQICIYNSAVEAGKEMENERIIKLLEQASLDFEQYDFNAVGTTNGLIALIKGEK